MSPGGLVGPAGAPSAPGPVAGAQGVASPVLEVREVSQHFGGLAALDGVDVAVPKGSVVGVIGPNGAGKTTLLNVVSGLQRPTQGVVAINGDDVTGWPADRLVRDAHVARTFQTAKLFTSMTVRDNIQVAAGASVRRALEARARTAEVLERFDLDEVADAPAGQLPYGVQRRVEVARALATKPALFLLDEPAAGLNAGERHQLGQTLVELAGEGMAIVLVEHQLDLVRSACSALYVLDFGRVIAQGAVADVMRDPAVIEAYVGVGREKED